MTIYTTAFGNRNATVTAGDSLRNADNYCVILTVAGKDAGSTPFTRDYAQAVDWANQLVTDFCEAETTEPDTDDEELLIDLARACPTDFWE